MKNPTKYEELTEEPQPRTSSNDNTPITISYNAQNVQLVPIDANNLGELLEMIRG